MPQAQDVKADVKPVFSFEVSAVDIILAVAVLVILAVLLTQKRGSASSTSQRPHTENQEDVSEKPGESNRTKPGKSPMKKASFDTQGCVHDFGYLRNMPPNTPVPDECFGCPKVMSCLFTNDEAVVQPARQ